MKAENSENRDCLQRDSTEHEGYELSIAAVTRGIENPNPRTSLTETKFKSRDFIVILVFISYLVTGILELV